MIRIAFGNYSFSAADGEIYLQPFPNMVTSVAPISDALEADVFRVYVRTRAFGASKLYDVLMNWYNTVNNEGYVIDEGEILSTIYSTPLYYYDNNVLKAKLYITKVQRTGSEQLYIECFSAIGLLTKGHHLGGIYFGETAGNIIADIMGDIDYIIDPDVAELRVYGWLPATAMVQGMSARDNLQQVLFAAGASVLKDLMGTTHIGFNLRSDAAEIPAGRIFLQSKFGEDRQRASKISLVEHTFFESENADEVVVYDNTGGTLVDGYDVLFSVPYHSYRGDGITINSSGANWVNISGVGAVYAVPYVHIKREIVEDLSVSAEVEPKSITVANATLVSALNSSSVMERLVNYYSTAVLTEIDILVDSEKCGDLVAYQDRYGDQKSGYISQMDETVSSFRKAAVTIVTDWVPKGIGNTYSEYFLITSAPNGTITIPSEHVGKKALVVLFSGAQGGAGGHNGEAGKRASWDEDSGYIRYNRGHGGAGGNGGAGGHGGGCGRYLMVDIDTLASTYSGSIGVGGAGGAATTYDGEDSEGLIGGDTVLGTFTTADGVVPEGPYINLIDGTIYGETGSDGLAGKAGGNGGDHLGSRLNGEDGENYNTVWLGGKGGLAFRDGDYQGSGAGGGGAAYGASATDVVQDNQSYKNATAGASPTAPAQASFYRGGTGGNGGGGGGGGAHYDNGGSLHTLGSGAAGGSGSVGGQGADGFILVYV